MGSQNPTGSDRSRTNWTPRMERYFIDLMLDQVHRGNRMGHTFNKQAWTDMLLVFNAKFGCQYDRDILKNRFTNLWKRYNDIKNLLDQSQFFWDPARQMVIADDTVWDAYNKAHPDAQSYKNKVLTSFNDLCLIYAHTSADGRYSRSSHDIDLDDDIQGVTLGVGIGNFIPEVQERTKKEWTPAMDQYFVELMLDQVSEGNKIDDTFTKQAWMDMLTLFNAKFCSAYGKFFLRNRYKKLDKYYTDAMNLLEQKGFSWDHNRQMIVATDDIWDEIIQAHPDAWSYRNKTLPNFQNLGLIYGSAFMNEPTSSHLHQDKNFEDDTSQIMAGEKVGRTSCGIDHLRVHWTRPMDHYLINLLLDQVLRGNKIGHSFISQAWTEVVSLFNGKFGSDYDKDVFKNRSKHLRRQYNSIKNLLEQNGFSWDDTQEMVIAEDYVWDSYAKAHRDVQSYRNRSVPSYHKLCVIYGIESSNGTQSPSVCNVDLESEGTDVLLEGPDIKCQANGDRSKRDWTSSMDRYLLDLMLEQVHKGKRINLNSNDQVWTDIVVSFGDRFGFEHNKHVLRSQHKSLGKQYIDMKNLLNQSGFFWDDTRQMVTAYDDDWDAYIEEHPDARAYRYKAKLNYNDLVLIYENSTSHCGGHQDRCSKGTKLDDNHHWRTSWTPPMDRYFIDLMLEQVRQGSMTDHKFNKQAWGDMIAKFNAEFGSKHDKVILQGRFNNLKKLFSDINILLSESGFSWDEMQQLLTADDDIWEAHMKFLQEHPDAQLYRHRSLPNYDDLFLIFGNATARRTHSDDSSQCEDVDQLFPNSDPLSIYWTKAMDRFFINLMLEQMERGNKIDQTFNKQAWDWMLTLFIEKFGLVCDKSFLENRYLYLMEQYKNITDLLNQDGFVWDETMQTVTAEDGVWEAYIQEHPDAIGYRCSIWDSYYDMCRIYGEKIPEGRSSCFNITMEIEEGSLEMKTDDSSGDISPLTENITSDRSKKRKSATLSKVAFSRKCRRSSKEMQCLTKTIVREDTKDFNSIESIVDALQTVKNMDDEQFLEACELLEDEKAAKMFVTMDITARRKWLQKKLRR